MNLPLELQLHVMSLLNLVTLQNIVLSTNYARDIFLMYPETLLQHCSSRYGAQLRNMMTTASKVILSVRNRTQLTELSGEDIEDKMETFLVTYLDSAQPQKILHSSICAFQVLDILSTLEQEMTALLWDYATDDYTRAVHLDNPGIIAPPLRLSRTETHRILRTCLRLKLFGLLFYNYVDLFRLDIESSREVFLSRLCVFEIDEMLTIYQFMVRHRYRLSCLCPSQICPLDMKFSGQLLRNRDPFECDCCQGHRKNPDSYPFCTGTRPFPRVQAFWSTMENVYLRDSSNGWILQLWVNPLAAGDAPVKEWMDWPEGNKPNTGWGEMRKRRDGGTLDQEITFSSNFVVASDRSSLVPTTSRDPASHFSSTWKSAGVWEGIGASTVWVALLAISSTSKYIYSRKHIIQSHGYHCTTVAQYLGLGMLKGEGRVQEGECIEEEAC
ncbi:hypothetical protein P154DRAFT_559292 [Amniculicola lignicola CBS 123094]|uniref:F-box domain-containing protein n=1 Tax=Amniculicola lignicola CBS 123094 TaxID=1392246 RepID=A0A6A5WWP4_9PLEO|nr:hypothetical protein P154DRAFT_559292 [Amniculicola lignicola CBS 123094]